MESYILEFVDYLEYIGFLTKDTQPFFIKLYNDTSKKNNRSKTKNTNPFHVLISTIVSYITSLSLPLAETMSKGLVDKFVQNKWQLKQRYLTYLLKIYSNKRKFSYFNKWRQYSLQKDSDILLDKVNTSQGRNSKAKISNTKTNFTLNSTIEQKIFQNNFIRRQEFYSELAKEKQQKFHDKKEEEMDLVYTFAPKVNSAFAKTNVQYSTYSPKKNNHITKIKKSKNTFERLYQNEEYNYKKNNNNIENENLSTKRDNNKRINNKAFYKLYKDHKEYEKNKKELQKEIDAERGITFKPKRYTSKSRYSVETNFDERNKKLIEDRENFIFVYDYLRQCKFNEQVVGNKTNPLLKNYMISTISHKDNNTASKHKSTNKEMNIEDNINEQNE